MRNFISTRTVITCFCIAAAAIGLGIGIIAGSYSINKSVGTWVEYHNSIWGLDTDSLCIYSRKGYILNQSHRYDTVDTGSGYDLILHFEKEQSGNG